MRSLVRCWPFLALMLALSSGAVFQAIRRQRDSAPAIEVVQAGHELFVRKWTRDDPQAQGDGLGPVFNAQSCVACHFQGGIGGGGDVGHNVLAYEVHPTVQNPKPSGGLVHAFAVDKAFLETQVLLRRCFPVIPGGDRVVGGCTVRLENFDPVRIETINSTALFGAGLIDRLSESNIRLHHAKRVMGKLGREVSGDFHGVGPGRQRALASGRLGRFGWKGQFAKLEEFVAAACANELGLGNPLMDQAKPLGKSYSSEKRDLTKDQFRQLVAFVASLPRPVETISEEPSQREAATRGKALFEKIGCAECHVPDLGDVAGIYSDLMLHSLTSKQGDGYTHEILVEVPLPDDHPKPDEWRTPPLWGVADSAPYFYDGQSPTLRAAIERHEGDAANVKKAFHGLPAADQQAVLVFLGTLRAPSAGPSSKSLLAAN